MRGFREPKRTQKFLSCFGPIRQHFALKRHLLRASLHRKQLVARFVAWRKFTKLAQIRHSLSNQSSQLPLCRLNLANLTTPG
jgi:hypothetical protein